MSGTYRKRIEVDSVGLVFGSVYSPDGRRVAHKSWGTGLIGPFWITSARVERATRKAHKWADEMIRVCKEKET
jgi:hypothetical protein